VHEAWGVLVVAALLYLALILRRTRAAIRDSRSLEPARRSPIAAACSARGYPICCSICSDYRRGGGWSRASSSSSRLSPRRPSRGAHDHPLALAALGFALVLLGSAALESIRLWRLPATLPLAPGGAFGESIGQGLGARSASTARR